jgi:hypothetical protein
MSFRPLSWFVVLLSISALAGCSSGASSSTTNGDGGAGGGGTGSNGVTCSAILTCISNQNCSTQDCIQGCIATGSNDAQATANALDDCYQANACQDSTCLQAKCPSQLSACTSQGSSGGGGGSSGGGVSVPAGSIPASFVGRWIAGDAADLGDEHQFVFNADGTASYTIAETSGSTTCTNTTSTLSTGTAVIDATTITLYEAASNTTQNECGTPSVVPEPAQTMPFNYTVDSNSSSASYGALLVTDAACAAQYPGDQASINVYCLYTYRKQSS